ncbi:unnamed protein product [Adineta steineri]|uniref:Uncharacterized protein n=3 Tax=Adineta steineri TaxID=433720 RepID=A0A815PKC3_9BILA|nr:unnamed protein product [Adineta steineri]
MSKNPPRKLDPMNKEKSTNVFNELNIRYRVCFKFGRKESEVGKDVCVCNNSRRSREETEKVCGFCNKPRSDHDKEEDICVCNKRRGSHKDKSYSDTEDVVWAMERNTKEITKPEHGILPNGALFLRLALDTPVAKVEKLLSEVWEISKPRLIMSVIGGAKYFTLSDRLESNFMNGIIEVALKSDTWLITNGYNVGIVQLVGQAINKVKFTKLDKHITAIGLCKWGSIKDVETITKQYKGNSQKESEKSDKMRDGGIEKKRESGEHDLEMNHSHYLMLDDGSFRFYSTEDYRTQLCVHLAKLHHETDFPLPVVTIVVEGGRDTIRNIYYDLRDNIPVIIIDGSGRVADFFKLWLLYTKEFDEASKHAQYPYEIGEIDKATPVKAFSATTDDTTSSKAGTHTYFEVQLDASRNTLKGMFESYDERLRKDLQFLLSRNDPSKGKKSNDTSNNNSKDPESIRFNKMVQQVMYCLQPAVRSSIAVFNLNSDDNLSETIFRTVCKSRQKYFERKESDENETMERSLRKSKPQPTPYVKQHHADSRHDVNRRDQNAQRSQLLQLAMDWDCINVAKELILQNSLDNILNKEEAFVNALTKDLPEFAYEFLKLDINPREIFFEGDPRFDPNNQYRKFLECLYNDDAVNSDDTQLSAFIQSDDAVRKQIHTTDDLNDVLATLIGDYMHKLYFDSNKDVSEYRESWGLTEQNIDQNIEQNQMNAQNPDHHVKPNKEIVFDTIMRDLFIWAILMNHTEMAQVFLSHMKYRICAALIATKILKQYFQRAPYGDLKDSYEKNAQYFEEYAISCIKQCEKNDTDQACEIVLQRIELYGNVTCLQIAADAKDKLFIATPCCVQAMNNIWYKNIHHEHSNKRNELAMVIGVFSLGLLAPFFVNYRDPPKIVNNEKPKRSLQSYGIHYSDSYLIAFPRSTKYSLITNYMQRIKSFHQASRTKYCYHCLYYFFFLLLFSYVLLFNFQPPTSSVPCIHWTEILTIILVFIMLIEEIHYFFSLDSITLSGKFKSYFRDLFKIMTLIGFILFFIGLILRFTHADDENEFVAARVVWAIDVELWWLRSLAFIIVIPFLGPHLVAIGKMLKDLSFFMCIIAIVMAGYGVASRSMVYYSNPTLFNDTTTDTSFDGRSIFRQIIYPIYYLIYGEFGKELDDLDIEPDAAWSVATHVLLAIHMLFVNILLTNLLIAMFSKRFDQVYDDTKNIWHSQQYLFTREYYTRSPFLPPISLGYDIYHLCRIVFFAIRRVCFKKSADGKAKVFKMIPINKDRIRIWHKFESASTHEYAHVQAKSLLSISTVSTSGSDSTSNENKDDTTDNANDSNNLNGDIRLVQHDLAKVNQSIDELKTQMEIQIETQTETQRKVNQSINELKTQMQILIDATRRKNKT